MASSTSTTALRRVSVLLAGGGVYASSAYLFYHYNYERKQVMTKVTFSSTSNTTQNASNPKDDGQVLRALSDGATSTTNSSATSGMGHSPPPSTCSCCSCKNVLDPITRQSRFQAMAQHYDNCIGWDEFFMGINWLRRILLFFHASGTCLEVGAGTGRNISYYRTSPSSFSGEGKGRVDRVLFTDISDGMLKELQSKIKKLNRPVAQLSSSSSSSGKESAQPYNRFAVLQANAASLKLPDHAFDTVVDTFGLCSYDDPVAVLKELARVCKPHGKILLLEHGRSKTWEWITQHLDRNVEIHAANWGCVWNKDIDAILQQSGLYVEQLSTYHFGTTYYIVCRPIHPPKVTNIQ